MPGEPWQRFSCSRFWVAVLRNPCAGDLHHLRAAPQSTYALRVRSQIFETRGPEGFEGVFLAIAIDRAQA